jgi:hypothetical protein
MRNQIEASATVTLLGVTWKATAYAEVEDNEYLYPDTVDIACLEDANGDQYGHQPPITVVFAELPDDAQLAIEMALGQELRDYLSDSDRSEKDYI